MDPQIKEDKPGKCPICHMDLTPIKKDNSASNEIAQAINKIGQYNYPKYRGNK
jgi:Cu(I)/Ag(I) efflux system membrane fusion protein